MSTQPQPSDAITIPKATVRQVAIGAGAVVGAIVVILLILALINALTSKDPVASAVNSSEFQAVFLTNGQVYFGKLSAPGGDFYYLRQVYYLSSQASPQAGRASTQRLIKLGGEIHAPEDLMVISRQSILFVENLKPTGQVSRAILRSLGTSHP